MSTVIPEPIAKVTIPVYDRPEIVAFLGTLPPDPERDRLDAELRRADAAHIDAHTRLQEVGTRLAAIPTALIGTRRADRQRLLAERRELTEERDVLREQLPHLARAYADAVLAWAGAVHGAAVLESETVAQALSPSGIARGKLTWQLGPLESGTEYLDQAAAMRTRIGSIDRERQPLLNRHEAAQTAVSMLEACLSRYFGDIRNGRPADPLAVERFVRRQVQYGAA